MSTTKEIRPEKTKPRKMLTKIPITPPITPPAHHDFDLPRMLAKKIIRKIAG